MHNHHVGEGGVRVYEGCQVKYRVALVRVPFYLIHLWLIPDRHRCCTYLYFLLMHIWKPIHGVKETSNYVCVCVYVLYIPTYIFILHMYTYTSTQEAHQHRQAMVGAADQHATSIRQALASNRHIYVCIYLSSVDIYVYICNLCIHMQPMYTCIHMQPMYTYATYVYICNLSSAAETRTP